MIDFCRALHVYMGYPHLEPFELRSVSDQPTATLSAACRGWSLILAHTAHKYGIVYVF